VVLNRKGEAVQKDLPAAVIKRWLEDDFSDFSGFRDLTGSINRWPDCGLVNVDVAAARELQALVVDKVDKTLTFDYTRLPPLRPPN
jgi:hypothetical protein